ncbi:hypothetical protein RYX36_003363 [Vicia faba]
MESKRSRIQIGSTSNPQSTPGAPIYPNFQFLFEANAKKYLKLEPYHVVMERAFDMEDLVGFEDEVEMIQQRHWSFMQALHKRVLLFSRHVRAQSSDSHLSTRFCSTPNTYKLMQSKREQRGLLAGNQFVASFNRNDDKGGKSC